MSTVTEFCKNIKQPRGGFIPISTFDHLTYTNNKELLTDENVQPSVIGSTVDYFTRYILGTNKEEAFDIPLVGLVRRNVYMQEQQNVASIPPENFLPYIKGLDEQSVISAICLSSYDVWARNMIAAIMAGDTLLKPDKSTVYNVQILIERTRDFFEKYGPVVGSGLTFGDAYTPKVTSGDLDYITNDTLWDLKVLRNKPDSKNTLQLLVYWIMGKHSKKKEFRNITKIGIYNPRLNDAYILEIEKISHAVIELIEEQIGY